MNRELLPQEFRRFPKHWEVLPFSDAIKDKTGGNPQIKQSDYLSDGSYPIIDQGKELIGGFSDDADQLSKVQLPCILFGDHTKELKYVDFKHILGADGVKALIPCARLDPRFTYYYLRQLSFPDNAGYSRHFKFLKEKFIPLPPLPEQKRIAAILDKADAIRRKRRQALTLADQFLRSVFLEMFGDPVTNPKGWPVNRFENLGVLARGKSRHRPRNAPELLGGPYPLIQTGDVASANHFITLYTQTYSESGLQQSKMWPAGTLCITIAANIADTAILRFDSCFPDSVVGFTPSNRARTEYIHMWLTFYQAILKEKAPESAQKNINLEILSGLLIPTPPIENQDRFCRAFFDIEQFKNKIRCGASNADDAFSSLTQRAFRGDL